MIRRVLFGVLILALAVLAGAALVGFAGVPAEVGLAVWVVGLVAGIVYIICGGRGEDDAE